MSKQRIPVDWKNCATCTHWCGEKNPDMFCQYVEFDDSERARCACGGFFNAQVQGMGSCPKWNPQFRR